MKPTFDKLESRDFPSPMLTLGSDPPVVIGSGPGTYADMMTPIYGATGTVTGTATGTVADTVMGSSTSGNQLTVGLGAGAVIGTDLGILPDGTIDTSALERLNSPMYTHPVPSQLQPTNPTNPQIAPKVQLLA